jgi:hypothetical protein
MSITKFEFWVGVCPGCASGGGNGLWFGDGIHQISVVRLGWLTDVHNESHSQFNGILIDINTIFPLNSPSSRLYSGSQDINSMLPIIVAKSRPRAGDEYSPAARHRATGPKGATGPANGLTARFKTHSATTGRCYARNRFPRRNYDPRQLAYDSTQED